MNANTYLSVNISYHTLELCVFGLVYIPRKCEIIFTRTKHTWKE